jgi:hypothetical protein
MPKLRTAGPPSANAVKHFVAKPMASFGQLGDAVESLKNFRNTKAGFSQRKMLHSVALHQQVRNHFSVHVGETVVPSLESIRKLRMVEAQQMQPCCLKVMNVHGFVYNRKA